MNSTIDFGYPWWLSYGHLILAVCALAILAIAFKRRWSRWVIIPLAAFTLWAGASSLIVHFAFNVNERGSLPTENFLKTGEGRVLDLGAGTGRSSIMTLEARPKTTLVALDLFGDSFDHHFGHGEEPQQRLLSNLKAAGVDQRVTITTSDMRQLPFEAASFDAAVSAYAIDHLNGDGVRKTLAEASRVVRPGGDFLLIVVTKEPWIQFAFGPLLAHGGLRDSAWWTARLTEAKFQIVEQGTRPATLYTLARRL